MKKRDLLGRRIPLAIIDRSAPYWQGSTAETILEQRRVEREAEAAAKASKRQRKTRSTSTRSRTTVEGPPALTKRLRRLERNVSRRKTLAARLRIEQEIAQIKQELGQA